MAALSSEPPTGRRCGLILAVVLLTVFGAGRVSGQSPPEAVTEWQVSTERARITSVDGIIRAAGRPRGWVRSRRGVSDLIVRLEFRVMTLDTRGAFLVRAWTDQTNRFPRTGYRIALRGQNGPQEALGQVRGLSKPVQPTTEPADLPVITLGEWHRLEVRCVDDTVEVRINGHLAHAATGTEPNAGLLGIEIDEGALEVRNVWLTPVVAEIPEGIAAVALLPDHAIWPRVRQQVVPRYSLDARERGVEGMVELEGVIGVDGRVSSVRIVRSLIPDLDAEAVAAVRQWRFHPATVDGTPTPTVALFHLSFRLHN